jgi:nitric oxide reductase NorQ protein
MPAPTPVPTASPVPTAPTTTAPPPAPPAVPPAPSAPPPAPSAGPSKSGRLPNGELRRQVAAFLAGQPGEQFTPGAIARALSDRSSGAVANALAALAATGAAEQTTARPVRYRATTTTATAAAAPAAAPSAAAVPAPARPAPARPARPKSPRTPTTAAGTATPSAEASPTAASSATPAEPVTGPVLRPNGQAYHPRMLADLPDVTALRRLRAAGVPALLYGPPGTGKTSVVEAAFPDLVTVAGDGDTTVADFVGEYTQTPDGRYVFVHGPLIIAMREGRPLFIDDATLIPPTVLAVVYPAMDGRRQITVKANGGETVTAAPGFYVVAGHNPGVHGAVLTDALSSRFSAQIHVSTDYDLARQLKIDSRAVRVARNLATRHAKGEIGWAPQLRELIAFERIAAVLGPQAAAGNLIGIAPAQDRDAVAAVVTAAFGATVAPLSLGRQIGTPT